MNDPVAAYFEKLPQIHKRQFAQSASGASFNFHKRLALACELASASAGHLLDCAAGTGEITCALLKSGRFSHATVVDISPAMLQSAKELLTSEIANAELEFLRSDVFNFKPSEFQFRSGSLPRIDCPCWAARYLTAAFEIDAGAGRAYHFADNTYRSRWSADRAGTHRAARARAARISHFLVLATGYRRRVRWCRPADRGDATAWPGHSVWRPALAVGEFSAGNPPAKVVEPARSGCDLPARTEWCKRDMPRVATCATHH